jgi:hypothetical protein
MSIQEEEFEERAAIMEFHGGLTRQEAERLAKGDKKDEKMQLQMFGDKDRANEPDAPPLEPNL